MKQCAFLSTDNLEEFECYDQLLVEPLSKKGWNVETVSWKDSTVRWDHYNAVIIRSTWDYQKDPQKFLNVLETIDRSSARLANSLNLVRWNIDKSYLKDIQQNDVTIVPTVWGDTLADDFSSFYTHWNTKQLIVKPVISANAENTFRMKQTDQLFPYLERTFNNRRFMVQPFMQNIVEEGEFSLFYFGDTYSHTILKTPQAGDFRVQEEHGGNLKLVEPEYDLISVGQKTMQAFPEMPLYTRLDFVRTDDNFALMEIELIEPSLYFNMDPDSPERFASIMDRWMKMPN